MFVTKYFKFIIYFLFICGFRYMFNRFEAHVTDVLAYLL
jgi:hypothetical protein